MRTSFILTLIVFFQVSFSQQWQQTTEPPPGAGITDMIVLANGNIIATTASYNWPNGQAGGIRRSADGGNTWQAINNVFNARTLWLGSTGKIFASWWPYPQNESMYYSTNGGSAWILMYPGTANDNVFSIASKDNDNTVFIGTRFGVQRNVNNGGWQYASSGIPVNTFVFDLDVDATGTYIAAGTSRGLYVSSNSGNNWNAVSGVSQSDTIYTIQFVNSTTDAAGDNILFTGSSAGKLFQSSSGAQYLAAVLVATFFGRMGDIEVVTNNVFTNVCVSIAPFGFDNLSGAGISISSNMGVSWTEVNNGLPSEPKMSSLALSVSGSNFNYFAGMYENALGGAKVFKMSIPIGLQSISNGIPESYTLSQNYPNPFNPSTKIRFSIPAGTHHSEFVHVSIHDILGREISILVNEKLSPGIYEATWDASTHPSGTYFYRLSAGNYSETKKMILVK